MQPERSLHHALDAGVNFIDTAALYNRSEERVLNDTANSGIFWNLEQHQEA